jgi:hypothetical protein
LLWILLHLFLWVQVDDDAIRKGERYEWLQLCFDKVLDPGAAFHIEVGWLVATSDNVQVSSPL